MSRVVDGGQIERLVTGTPQPRCVVLQVHDSGGLGIEHHVHEGAVEDVDNLKG